MKEARAMWTSVKNWFKSHDMEFIAILAATLIYCAWAEYTDRRTAKLTAEHIELIAATESIKKEVKNNAEAIHRTQAENDRKIREQVKNSAASVPDDITALVDMANAVIRRSQSGK